MGNNTESVRHETDSIGSIEVSNAALWGAASQRSLKYFAIGRDLFTPQFINCLCQVKEAAATVNFALGNLDKERASLIQAACAEVLAGKHENQFPLSVWQTGSGTQTNMNVNEVLANIGNRNSGAKLGAKAPLHPNDHVNLSQSSNDVFPTAMHMVARQMTVSRLLPSLKLLQSQLDKKAIEFQTAVKSGRTHMMDATPVTLGQEFGAFSAQIQFAIERISESLELLLVLPIGGTAVGTGYNSDPQWAQLMVKELSKMSGCDFQTAENRFSQMASHDALRNLHSQIAGLATALYKLASDMRLMNSGPRCGLGEISIPANEPGSSIMPGKINPTQIEALTMICLRVIGNDTSITMANSQGQFQLNTYKPLIIHLLLESIELLADSCNSFTIHCLAGIEVNKKQIESHSSNSLMLATALVPTLGYDQTAKLVEYAHERGLSLKDAAVERGDMSREEFEKQVNPLTMLAPTAKSD